MERGLCGKQGKEKQGRKKAGKGGAAQASAPVSRLRQGGLGIAMGIFLAGSAFAGTLSESIGAPEIRNSGNDITVTWENPGILGLDKYEVQLLRQGSGGTYGSYKVEKNLDASEGTSCDFTVNSKGYYKARVRAKDVSNNYTPWSDLSADLVAVTSEDVSVGSFSGGGYPLVGTRVSSSGGPGAKETQSADDGSKWNGPGVPSSSQTVLSASPVSTPLSPSSPVRNAPDTANRAGSSASQQDIGSSGEGYGWSSTTTTEGRISVNTYTSTGWQRNQNGRWYLYENGTYPLASWRKIDGVLYHFNEYGYMDWNRWIHESNGNWYFCTSDGHMAVGWNDINGRWYYMDPSNGVMLTEGEHIIDGKYYYIEANGARAQDVWAGGHYYGPDGARTD